MQRAQFEHAIAVLTGKPPAELTIPPAAPPVSAIGLPSTLLERRPDIAASERQVAASNEQIGIAKAAHDKRRAQIKVTAAAYDAAVANCRQTVLSAFQQVEDDLAQLRYFPMKPTSQTRPSRPPNSPWGFPPFNIAGD